MSRALRLFPIAVLSVSLFAVERLRPVEVARYPSFSAAVVFDSNGFGYVSHGRVITRISPDGTSAVWSELEGPRGHKILPNGSHLVCDAGRRAVLSLDANGKITGVASSECDGKPLREPNDLALDPRGGFYFTDSGGTQARPAGAICFVDSLGKTHLAARDLQYPNGIVLRPDGKTLLVAESRRNRILSYDVLAPGRLGPMKVFADLPSKQGIDNQPDGMCLDLHGNLYVAHSGMKVVEVFSRKGRWIRQYPAGLTAASDVAFGGAKMNQLYISGGVGGRGEGGLFRLDLRTVKGLTP